MGQSPLSEEEAQDLANSLIKSRHHLVNCIYIGIDYLCSFIFNVFYFMYLIGCFGYLTANYILDRYFGVHVSYEPVASTVYAPPSRRGPVHVPTAESSVGAT